ARGADKSERNGQHQRADGRKCWRRRGVRSGRRQVAAAASPSSLQLSLESAKLKEALSGYIDALQGAGEPADDIVGYVFAINGKITGGDVYPSSKLSRKMWREA